MNSRAWLIIAMELLVAVVVVLVLSSQLTKQKARADTAESLAKQRQETINDMQVRQRDVAALDAKYTKELADAKASIDELQSDVVAGRKRLQLNATCKKQSTSGSPSLDDAASPGLTDSAQRDYFTLRERIETSRKMIAGLQQYIREQCLK
ncbi:lysis protein [Erwinia aphidicola]|uniref:Lysis protein n=1 Tax=Erwinia aphidicola TaxID=68334 RepID=A0ABU8DM67_ERWAP